MDSLAPPVLVERWKRYGHDRAYVKVAGQPAGYRDLRDGSVHCTLPEHREAVRQATEYLMPARLPEYRPRHAAGLTPDAATTDTAAAPETAAAARTVVAAGTAAAPDTAAAASTAAGPGTAGVPAGTLLPDVDLAANPPGGAARTQALRLREAAPVRTFVARVFDIRTDERAWRIGADAEQEVARRLARLGPDWRVLHALPVGERDSDIDHLVVGPTGVFTINTKHHPDASVWVAGDTVKVNGRNLPYVRNSRHEARRAGRLLSRRALFDVEVHGVIAVMGATGGFTVKQQPRDGQVTVVTRRGLVDHLQARPVALGAPSIERIYQVARHLATWQPNQVAWSDAIGS